MTKLWLGMLALALVSGTASAQQDGSEGKKTSYDLLSDGTRLNLEDKGLSIAPPAGWEVFTSHPNLTLLLQVPYSKALKYQRTIQIASFAGPRYMDAVTGREFEELIVRKFSQVSTSIEGYRVRNSTPITLADWRDGLLYYAEFKLNGMALMQAHILISSPKRHYLMTFTDVAEHFERDEVPELTEAWNAMTSVELKGRSPQRFESFFWIMSMAGVLAVLGTLTWLIRTWRAGKAYKNLGDGRSLEDEDIGDAEPHVSNALSKKSVLQHTVSEHHDGDDDDLAI